MIYAQGPEDKMSVGISHSLEVCGGKLVCQVCHTFKKFSLEKLSVQCMKIRMNSLQLSATFAISLLSFCQLIPVLLLRSWKTYVVPIGQSPQTNHEGSAESDLNFPCQHFPQQL